MTVLRAARASLSEDARLVADADHELCFVHGRALRAKSHGADARASSSIDGDACRREQDEERPPARLLGVRSSRGRLAGTRATASLNAEMLEVHRVGSDVAACPRAMRDRRASKVDALGEVRRATRRQGALARRCTTNQPSRGRLRARRSRPARAVASSIAGRYPGSMTSFSLRQVKLRPGEQYPRSARGRAAGVRVRRPALRAGAGAGAGAARGHARDHRHGLHASGFTRAAARAVLPLPRRRRARGADHAREYQAEEPEDEELTTPYLVGATSTSRSGRATRSRSRCRTRSSAARTARACAPSAART